MADSIRPYGPGKFDTILDMHLWEMSLDGADEETGDSSMGVYYCLLRGPFSVTTDLTKDELALLSTSVGVIMSEDGQGFVSVEYFDNLKDLDAAWKECEAEVARFEDMDAENNA